MAHNYIIQWNCRGLKGNREYIELLISKYYPAVICLQETLLKPGQTQTFKHYSAYYKSGIHGHGGVCILAKPTSSIVKFNFRQILMVIVIYVELIKRMNVERLLNV